MNCKEVTHKVEKEIQKFENSLCYDARKFLDSSDVNRHLRSNEIRLPFLKLNAKIHKMSRDDILAKNVSKLKFRPVQDSS